MTALAFSHDGACLVVTDEKGNQFAWDMTIGKQRATVPALPARPEPGLSPDGHTLA